MAVRKIISGNDFFKEIISANGNDIFKATYWDLWISFALTHTYNADKDKLINAIQENSRGYSYNSKFEAIITHIKILDAKLVSMELRHTDILSNVDIETLKKLKIKTKRKVMEMGFEPKEKSSWMKQTPRILYHQNALTGNWDNFPVNPHKYIASFESKIVRVSVFNESKACDLAEKLSLYIEKNANKPTEDLMAFYRAFLTVIINNIGTIDDSFGQISMLVDNVIDKYLNCGWRQTDLSVKLFYHDLIMVIICENYGLIDSFYSFMFKELSLDDTSVIEGILYSEIHELRSNDLNRHADSALTLLAELYIQNKLFEKFVPAAKEMGSREWKRIVDLSKTAENDEEYSIALNVFEAALSEPSHHSSYLRTEKNKLKHRLKTADIK
jgi:hypothetical protein